MTEIEKLLSGYEVDVNFPDVSGMEHVQMLMARSKLFELENNLTTIQRKRLLAADQKLLGQADLFFAAIQRIADLSSWRNKETITSDQWWWYLDVLAKLPEHTMVSSHLRN